MSDPGDTPDAPAPPTIPAPTIPPPPVTGDAVVDEAVSFLQDVMLVPVAEQPGTYESVHRTLQDRLADVEG